MKIYYLFLSGLLGISNAAAQSFNDTTYFKAYPQKFTVLGYIADNSVYIKRNGDLYQPNNKLNLGFGLTLKNTLISFQYDFGVVPLKGKEFGNTHVFDFQVHKYGRSFVLDITAQDYRGFFYQKNQNSAISLFPKLSVFQLGAEATYIFNSDRFSARAAFDQSQIQVLSAGSFLLGGGSYFYQLKDQNQTISFDNSNIDNYQIGINTGYAYNDVLSSRWMLSAMITAGANFGNEPKLLNEGKIRIYPTAFARASASYHKTDWDMALTMLLHNTHISNLQNETIGLVALNFQATYVRHLDHLFKCK